MNVIKKIVFSIFCLSFLVSLGILISNYFSYTNTIPNKQTTINLSLSILAAAIFLLLIIGLVFIKKTSHWWFISMSGSLLFFLELCLIWVLVYKCGLESHPDYTMIENRDQLNAYTSYLQQINKNFTFIPTGIFIEHIIFSRQENDIYPGVILNGIIWQRYSNDIPTTIDRNFLLPDAVQLEMKKIIHQKTSTEEIIGWRFSASIFQRFDLTNFPFDYRHIKIQILHADFEENVIPIPDLMSYDDNSPQSLPGISKQLKIPHWTIFESFFSYAMRNFHINFGLKNFNFEHFPQFYFYVTTHRMIVDTILIYFILLLISAIALFISLMTFLKREKLSSLSGFSIMGILGVATSLLFVLLASHVEIRSNVAIDGTAYFEYLYLILYFAIIAVSIDSFMFTLHEKIFLIQYKDNLIIKLLYWPVLLFSTLLITILHFKNLMF